MHKNNISYLLYLFLIFFFCSCNNRTRDNHENIQLENEQFCLTISSNGHALSLIHKPTGQECLASNKKEIPLFSITQDRPYDNELQLTYPAKQRTFPVDSVYKKGDKLIVTFKEIKHIATIGLKITNSYIGFELENLDYNTIGYREKIKTPVDKFTLLQLPIKKRKNFGEWLNVAWDDQVAVNLLATNPYTQIDAAVNRDALIMEASGIEQVKTTGIGTALIVTAKDKLLDCIDQIEQDYNLPRGVQSRKSDEYKYSYYEVWDITTENIDEHISYAKRGGFQAIQIVWTSFASSIGHFSWRPEYPNGMKDLQEIVTKIKDAGMVVGAHFWYNKAQINDPYVSPLPDYRLNLRRLFTLTTDIDQSSSSIEVEENPDGCTLDDQRRVLKIGSELIEYQNYTTHRPYRFTGCKRGAMGTKTESYKKGLKFGLLDVDTWPIWVRFDQRTSIQQEMAEKISKIYSEAGFDFIYFDGAEDTPPPYWFNSSMSQLKVYDCLEQKPLFSEGAIKSHFNWHLLTRGNAFDVFRPEVIKAATREHPAAEAEMIVQNFSAINFGWIDYLSPDSTTIGMQPDMYEYVCSRAAAWDCPVSILGKLDQLKKHPRTDDNLQVLSWWEKARNQGWLSYKQKESLKKLEQEHILLKNKDEKFELYPSEQIQTGEEMQSVRAFVFTRDKQTWIVYWHPTGSGNIHLGVGSDKIHVFDQFGEQQEIQLQTDKKGTVLPIGKRRYIRTDMTKQEAVRIFANAEVINN